jgi:hypothetical protein
VDTALETIAIASRRVDAQFVHQSMDRIGGVFERTKHDTVLSMGNAISEIGSMEHIFVWLESIKTIIYPKGQMILSIKDPSVTTDSCHIQYQTENREKGLPIGAVRYCLKYKEKRSEYKRIIYLTESSLEDMCLLYGFQLKKKQNNEK